MKRKPIKTISIYPTHTNNKYIPIIISVLKSAGFDIVPIEQTTRKINHIDAFIFNWYETLPRNHRWYHFFRRCINILVLKLLGKQVNCTIHNRQPHEGQSWYSTVITKLLLKASDHVFILCDDTLDVISGYTEIEKIKEKIVKIPLPTYTGVYGSPSDDCPSMTGEMKCLYFGEIKPYKNTGLLIESVMELEEKCKIHLTIAGKCLDNDYINQLKTTVKKSNAITLDIRYVPDEEIVEMLKQFDLLILPYNIQSSLNSSAVVLAFSYKRTVISPLIGTLKELPYEDISYAYVYDGSDDDHRKKLKETILLAYGDYVTDPKRLRVKGQLAYEAINLYNSKELLKDIFENTFHT